MIQELGNVLVALNGETEIVRQPTNEEIMDKVNEIINVVNMLYSHSNLDESKE